MSRQILAIDIRQDAIEAVLINTGLKTNTVSECATVALHAVSDTGDPLVEALDELRSKIDPATANVLVAIPSDGALYRKLSVPFKEDAKIHQVLPFELEPLLPIGVDSLKVDFHKNHLSDQTELLAIAMDESVVQRYMDALSDANIRAQLIVPGSFALANYLSSHDELALEQILILDIDIDKMTLFATDSGKIELIRRLFSKIDSEQAAEALALRIRQTLTAMSDNQTDFLSPSKVYITGPGLKDPEAFNRIALAMDLPVENLDMAQWAPRLDMDENLGWAPEQMNNALALALTEIDGLPCANFHRISSPLRNYWNAYRTYIMGPAVLLAVALFIGLAGVVIDSYLLGKRVEKLDAQLRQVYLSEFPDSRAKGDPVDLFESKIKELKKGSAAGGLNPSPVRSIDVLLQASQLIPKSVDVLFTRMTMGAESLTISGETSAFNNVDDIKGRLEKGTLFKQVTIASANMNKSGNKVRFKLKIDL